jgi:hypothetical protein
MNLLIFFEFSFFPQGNPTCEVSSTATGGSDESSSTPQDGDESDLGPDTDDEIDTPVAENPFISPERKISNQMLYTWKEVSGIQHETPPVRMRDVYIYIILIYGNSW